MAVDDQTNSKVQRNTRTVSFNALVKRRWGAEYTKPDWCYRMSNGRKFLSTDRDESGVYRRS